jgi:hypothetical protein
MVRMSGSPVVSLVAAVALLLGVAFLSLAAWGRPLREGIAASRDGNHQLALEHYLALQRRFDGLPVTKQVLAGIHRAALANQLRLHYHFGEYDKVIELATASPSNAAVHFWAGCALFEKARAEDNPDELLAWLNRAEGEFRKALEASPEDWDSKFNYEMTRRILDRLRENKEVPPDKLLPKLLEQPRPMGPPRRVG